ncbi:hypothetical protein POM88_046705 [Heracleum sosnowskyi]|uniref:Uncharacterized protein n=1 Tax=Heracleum sosnowskyi TaxID=360622 RepID=A0AAD8H944_9APIA|nr:hypothetical protein POM88_046705 [Heracleum sosnowskyi]
MNGAAKAGSVLGLCIRAGWRCSIPYVRSQIVSLVVLWGEFVVCSLQIHFFGCVRYYSPCELVCFRFVVLVVLIVFTALSVGSGFLIHLLATGDGGFGNSGGDFGGSDGGGGGGGAGGGGFWSRLQSYLVANAKEDESQSKRGPHTIA